jgi:LPXTG-motif cell wall-anchored protein
MKAATKYLLGTLIVLIILVIISVIITLFAKTPILSSLRIVFGSVYVLFLPGFIISYIFFPKTHEFDNKNNEEKSIDWIERIALSFALSIAIVPLAVFYLNLIGLKINLLNSFLTILGILIISVGILYYKFRKNK